MRAQDWIAAATAPVVLVGVLAVGALSQPSSASTLTAGTVPAAYAGLISRYGGACPTLTAPRLAAQLYAESRFNPRAVSAAGAVGLAQFLPSTWATHGVDGDDDGRADPYDPADAIASAAAYDCELAGDVRTVPGDPVDLMLAAYNAGPYAVLAAAGVPAFAETKHYVAEIRSLEAVFGTSTPVVPPSQAGAKAVAYAYAKLGTPYEWGGTGADGRFDCSGLTGAAYRAAGISLPRTSREQWYAGPHVARDQLQTGDLVFYANDLTNPATIHHVGIYVSNGYMIDAPYTGAVIRFDPVDQPDYMGAIRPSAGR